MKKTVAKLTLGLTSTAILATVGAQTVSASSYVVQDGDSFFGMLLQMAWILMSWQQITGKVFLI